MKERTLRILEFNKIKDKVEKYAITSSGKEMVHSLKPCKSIYEVEKKLENCNKNIKVAVMGCVVNGPGEAREADIGIAGGKGEGLIFKKGEIIKKVKEEDLIEELMKEIENL